MPTTNDEKAVAWMATTVAEWLSGMCVIESPYLEQDGEPYTVRRGWRERLFGRPWRPFVATRVVVPKVPYPGALQIDATTLVMHPVTLRQLRESLKAAT